MGDEKRLSGVLGDRRMRQLSDHLDLLVVSFAHGRLNSEGSCTSDLRSPSSRDPYMDVSRRARLGGVKV